MVRDEWVENAELPIVWNPDQHMINAALMHAGVLLSSSGCIINEVVPGCELCSSCSSLQGQLRSALGCMMEELMELLCRVASKESFSLPHLGK